MEDFRLRMGIATSLAPRASASYRGIFLQKSGGTLRDSEFTLQGVWNSLYDTGVEGSGLKVREAPACTCSLVSSGWWISCCSIQRSVWAFQ